MFGSRIGDGPVDASQQALALASRHFAFRTVLALFFGAPFLAVLFLAVIVLAALGFGALFFRAGRLGELGLDEDLADAPFFEGAGSVANVSSA